MVTKTSQYIVVGVDGSDSALRAVRWAADEAARRKAPLRLVTAFGWTEDVSVGQPGLGARYRDILLDQSRRALATAVDTARSATWGRTINGHPARRCAPAGGHHRAAGLVLLGGHCWMDLRGPRHRLGV